MAQLRLKQLDSVLTGSLQVSGSAGVTGSLNVDTNIVAGNRITADYGTITYSLTVNEGGHGGGDFRVEGTSDPYLIFADAGTNKLAIGTSVVSPSLLTVDGDITATHITASGNIGLNEYIHHNGDADTYIQFDTDEINFVVGAANMIYLNEGGAGAQADKVTINNDLADVDFQVKGDNEANLIRTDAANDRVGIGTSNPEQILHVLGNIFAKGHITGSNISASGYVYGDGSQLTGITSGIFQVTGSSHNATANIQLSGSLAISGSTFTVTTGYTGSATASTAIYTNNIQNGYPTSNQWGTGLEGSYFNNFDNTTHVSEILRFIAGAMSSSLDVSDASANTRTFASVDTNETNLGGTDVIYGYLPQNHSSLSNTTINYLNLKDWWKTGEKCFDGISVYHDNGGTYYVDFDSNSGGSTSVQSSVDSELFGLGGLSSGAATQFDVKVVVTQSFSDTGSIAHPSSSNTFTTQSKLDLSISSFGTSNGLSLAKITSSQPAVIPAAYQDGKFADVGGTSLSGSLTRKWHATSGSFTSVSSSGYYSFHDLKIAIATGSGNFSFVDGTTTNNFWAPVDTIDSAIGTNTLADVGTKTKSLTCVSRSLSGTPYVTGSTFEVSTKITGLFNPGYKDTSTLVDMAGGSVGFGTVSVTDDTVSTAAGTIQTANVVYDSAGSSARSTGTVPYYNDIVLITGSVDWDAGSDDNISQTGTGDTSFTVATKARNRNGSQSTLDTQTIPYHTAGAFGQPTDSGSVAVYGREQGYDGGALTGTTEVFTGESYRLQLTDEVLGWSGSAFSTSFNISQVTGTRLIGEQDLQVKPGYLVDPGGDYGYWYPENYGSSSYKYYIRRFQTSGTKTSMTVNLNNNTLVNWKATTADSVACGLLFKSSASGSGTTSTLSRARIYDPSETTSNLISSSVAHSNDFHLNPFNSAFDLYGNSGGSVGSNTYTVPMRNSDGMYLDNNDNELYVIVRYSGDPTPLDDITLTFS